MSILDVRITHKTYPARGSASGHHAIGKLDFSVKENEFVGILGPSGCGKTTLLNLIAGLDSEYEGEIVLADDARDHLAYVFQTPRLLPWRTVRDNIALAVGETWERADTVPELIASVGLEGFADSYPGQLSLGMQRRVSLARAFACDPRILLMDEPFVSLDASAAGRLLALLLDILGKRPATVLFVTHDPREAVMLADRILLLSEGPTTLVEEIKVTLGSAARANTKRVEAFCQQHLSAVTPHSQS